jgi:hypothetical protein
VVFVNNFAFAVDCPDLNIKWLDWNCDVSCSWTMELDIGDAYF